VVGRFLSVDSVQGNMLGFDPYAYTGGNPETFNDPTGHCWPWCTILAGAIIGAVAAVVTDVVTGQPVTWQSVAEGAVGGAVVATVGVALVGVGIASATGAALMDVVASASTIGSATWWTAVGGGAIGGAISGAATGLATRVINHFWPSPPDPASYQAGANAQATADAQHLPAIQTAAVNNAYATATATAQQTKKAEEETRRLVNRPASRFVQKLVKGRQDAQRAAIHRYGGWNAAAQSYYMNRAFQINEAMLGNSGAPILYGGRMRIS
jgi:hypothetical protein